MKEFDSNLQVKLLHKVYAYGWSYVFQVVFRTGQAQLCQSNLHISSREVTA